VSSNLTLGAISFKLGDETNFLKKVKGIYQLCINGQLTKGSRPILNQIAKPGCEMSETT